MAEQDKASVPAQAAPRQVDPFSTFRSEMDRLIEGFFGGRSPFAVPSLQVPDLRLGDAGLVPQVDVKEDEAQITVTAELPGLTGDDVEVTLDEGILTLKGEKREDKTDATAKLTERRYGRFMRSFRLPDRVDEEKVTATVDHGVLHITLPKNPKAARRARSIPIGGKTA